MLLSPPPCLLLHTTGNTIQPVSKSQKETMAAAVWGITPESLDSLHKLRDFCPSASSDANAFLRYCQALARSLLESPKLKDVYDSNATAALHLGEARNQLENALAVHGQRMRRARKSYGQKGKKRILLFKNSKRLLVSSPTRSATMHWATPAYRCLAKLWTTSILTHI